MKLAKKVPKKTGKKRKKVKKILTPAERERHKRKKKLNLDVKSFFRAMGYEYIATNGVEKKFGDIPGELDGVFIYENIIILCEETINTNHDHLRTKYDYYQKICESQNDLLEWLKKLDRQKFKKFQDYSISRYHVFYLYITESPVDEEIRSRYPEFKYLGPKALRYFLRVSQSIRFSSRNEFYKFLNLDLQDVGNVSSSNVEKQIDSAVIIPESSSGFPIGVHIVSFVMKAKELLDCAYVFRKDNWENKVGQYYQRLIDKNKIEKIRTYLAKEGRTFIDNIIVSLPAGTTFAQKLNSKDKAVDVTTISTIKNVQIKIPYKINSIGIIDGQHRVFGHYEGNDSLESKIAIHRDKRHLFVTGIFYEEGKFDEFFKRTFESELFLLMNNSQSKVRPDLLQYIETLKSPLSPLGVAGNVLMKLNERAPFLNMFLLSPLDKIGIKTPTIVKFGLQGLVEISKNKETLFKYWSATNKKRITEGKFDEKIYSEYIRFCSNSLAVYFSAIRENYKNEWNLDKDNRLLTSTAIVAFIKSFATALQKYKGVQNFEFYCEKFAKLTLKFSKGAFAQYGSSHWPKLAIKIDTDCWE